MTTSYACGSVMEDEKLTEKELPPEKKLKLDVDDDLKGEDDTGSDLKGEDDTRSDLKGEDGEYDFMGEYAEYDFMGEDDTGSDLKGEDGEYDFMGEDDTGSGLKGEDGQPLNYDPYDWQTYPDKDVFIKYYQQLRESDGKERKVTDIVKINAGGCRDFTYYITFKIETDGKEETFQAKVERTIEKTIEIPICRRKVD
ncbi:uncharacterized protein LOC132608761 isoform X2 [Lycium barbarum]|uniref:uncharacterized protein LOC132608761 isoform X2 n=1 Tax=Lycium barbarum TaxID=112863 RepID=UPI00293E6FC2|nr:uncharacterized protein LOC132608761 isoform X2 [Lycium barbarum]